MVFVVRAESRALSLVGVSLTVLAVLERPDL